MCGLAEIFDVPANPDGLESYFRRNLSRRVEKSGFSIKRILLKGCQIMSPTATIKRFGWNVYSELMNWSSEITTGYLESGRKLEPL